MGGKHSGDVSTPKETFSPSPLSLSQGSPSAFTAEGVPLALTWPCSFLSRLPAGSREREVASTPARGWRDCALPCGTESIQALHRGREEVGVGGGRERARGQVGRPRKTGQRRCRWRSAIWQTRTTWARGGVLWSGCSSCKSSCSWGARVLST